MDRQSGYCSAGMIQHWNEPRTTQPRRSVQNIRLQIQIKIAPYWDYFWGVGLTVVQAFMVTEWKE